MKKVFFLFFLVNSSILVKGQSDSIIAVKEIKSFQKEITDEYTDRRTSPLNPKDFRKFKVHSFYPINLRYRVLAKMTLTPDADFAPMQTSNGRQALYRVYAFAEFTLNNQFFKIPIYQGKDLMATKEYTNYLFLPFTDLTNGKETYAAGRYIGLKIPKEGNELIIDFNMAYNPYCAYSDRYSCPVVPAANNLATEIRAGLKYINK
jgi:uncharacterized protein (DUF1684 family)